MSFHLSLHEIPLHWAAYAAKNLALYVPWFNLDGPLKFKVSYFQKCLQTFYWLNCSQTNLSLRRSVNLSLSITGMLKKNSSFYVPRYISDGPLYSKVSEIFPFQALALKILLALEPRVLKLEGSSFFNQALYPCPKGGLNRPPPQKK